MSMVSLATWIETITGVTTIIAPFNGPAPSGEYISIQDISGKGDCYPVVEKVEDVAGVKFSAQIDEDLTLSVNAYSVNGRSLLNKLKASASLPPVKDRPIMADCGDIRNLAFLNDTEFAPRYQCDFVFREPEDFEVVDPAVERVEITGDFSGMTSEVEVEIEP